MFDALTNLTKAAANVVTLPVSVVADIVTMGGFVTERKEPYTVSKAKRIAAQASDALDDLAS